MKSHKEGPGLKVAQVPWPMRLKVRLFCFSAVSKMSATRYRRFLKLCEEWPRDESKKARDLGTFLRQRVAAAFREGESTQLSDPEKCDQMYESLARLNSNVYRQKFPRVRDTSFTGVTVEECRVLLSGMYGMEHHNMVLLLCALYYKFYFHLQEVCNRWMKKRRVCGRH
uniref:Mitochondrial nucleoid factor 1 n=1 Tax=Neogobius melanostomus TaxID=47308 RepID=A0A8C6SGG1_9GOBI